MLVVVVVSLAQQPLMKQVVVVRVVDMEVVEVVEVR